MPRCWLAVCAMLLGLATQAWSQLRGPVPKRTGQIVNYYPILSRVHTPELNPQTKADTLRVPFVSLECEEPTSLGAAILAGSALRLGEVPALARQWVKVRKRFDPQ